MSNSSNNPLITISAGIEAINRSAIERREIINKFFSLIDELTGEINHMENKIKYIN